MSELDPRKQTILRAIVFEYVSSAEPIASETLVQKYDLGVRSATIRNEMAEMSEMGYLEQPHTSAGRVPSDRGYRYYVDKLILRKEPELESKQKLTGATEEGEVLQELLRDTTRTLSRITHLLSAATIVRDGGLTIRHAVVSAMGPKQALLVLVLSNGHVENRMLDCPVGLTLDEVGQVNEALSNALANKPLRSMVRSKPPELGAHSAAEKLMALIWGTVRNLARELTRGALITEGEEFMFGQPEFQRDVAALTDLLETLKESDVLYEAIGGPADQPQSVRIGRENRSEQLRHLSVVRQSFYVGKSEAGTIAIIGPTRMAYDTGIPLVSYTARALSESLTKFLG